MLQPGLEYGLMNYCKFWPRWCSHIYNITLVSLAVRFYCSLSTPCAVDILKHVEVEGDRWTRFWWYNPISGWPEGEGDILGGVSDL